MALTPSFTEVDAALAAGGAVLVVLGSMIWKVEAATRGALEAKRFDGEAYTSLERRYLDSHSFRGLYNAVHDIVNQPPFMVAGMALSSIIAILIGVLYVSHPEIALPFIVLVFVLGLIWYFGDALESTLVIAYAAKLDLRKSDKENVGRYRELARMGKHYLLVMGIFLLAASLLDGAGLVPYISRPFGVLLLALVAGLALLAAWRSTLAANRPVPG